MRKRVKSPYTHRKEDSTPKSSLQLQKMTISFTLLNFVKYLYIIYK